MSSRVLFPLIGLAIVTVLLGLFLYANRGSHIEIKGEILKVRLHSAEESSSVAVIDFRFVNPANYPFVVRSVDVAIEDQNGNMITGAVIADSDAARYFSYYPVLGQKFNDSLVVRERIAPKQQLDKMVMVRFETPEATLANRRALRIRVEEVDGAVSEIVEGTRR